MQIVDSGPLGVRVVLMTLRRQETPLRFRMFPTLHIGRPEFYREVRARVERCDLAVVEGVSRSSVGSSLTLSYRLITRNRRHGLVEQDIGPNTLDIPVINPDLNGEEVDAGWRRVPARRHPRAAVGRGHRGRRRPTGPGTWGRRPRPAPVVPLHPRRRRGPHRGGLIATPETDSRTLTG
jgi:hypothetical protein